MALPRSVIGLSAVCDCGISPSYSLSIKIICTDSTEILFSKLRSAGLNYHLPKQNLFTFPYCAGVGVSNKHCLLTVFHCQ